MLRHCAVLIVVIAITCQFYCTNAAYSLFNIYHGLVLSLFAITRLQGHSPGDHAVTALGLRYIHCYSLSQHCFLQMCAIMAGHCKILRSSILFIMTISCYYSLFWVLFIMTVSNHYPVHLLWLRLITICCFCCRCCCCRYAILIFTLYDYHSVFC